MKKEYEKPIVEIVSFEADEEIMRENIEAYAFIDGTPGTSALPEGWH